MHFTLQSKQVVPVWYLVDNAWDKARNLYIYILPHDLKKSIEMIYCAGATIVRSLLTINQSSHKNKTWDKENKFDFFLDSIGIIYSPR